MEEAELKIYVVSRDYFIAFLEMAPVSIAPLMFALVTAACVRCFNRSAWKASSLEVLFFGFAGAVAAYLNYLSVGSLLENAVPQLVVLMTIFFQLLGLSMNSASPPLYSGRVFVSGVACAVSFMLTSRYITRLFG